MGGFVNEYFPTPYRAHTRALYDGLRNALLHEHGTRGVALTENQPEKHLTTVGGLLVLDIGTLVKDCDKAFEKFYGELKANEELRGRAVSASRGLLQLVQLQPTPEGQIRMPLVSAFSASATSPNTKAIIRDP
jgi:hypothetical protein